MENKKKQTNDKPKVVNDDYKQIKIKKTDKSYTSDEYIKKNVKKN